MKSGLVMRGFERPDAGALEKLGRYGVATVHEAQGRGGLMQPYMRPIYPGARTVGSAITVYTHPGDNWMLHVAAEEARPGDVIVVALSSECSDGLFGELLATSYRTRGVAGLVIDAGVRDVCALREMKFPVWSRAISAKGTVKATVGSVNVSVVCAGMWVQAGDAIVADDDGVVVVPRTRVAEVAAAAEQRGAKEEGTRARLAKGELGLDVYAMRDKLAAAGLRYAERVVAIER